MAGRPPHATPNDPCLVVQRGINSTYLGDAQVPRAGNGDAVAYRVAWIKNLHQVTGGRLTDRHQTEDTMAAQTLFDKIWDAHVVADLGSGMALLPSTAISCTTSAAGAA